MLVTSFVKIGANGIILHVTIVHVGLVYRIAIVSELSSVGGGISEKL